MVPAKPAETGGERRKVLSHPWAVQAPLARFHPPAEAADGLHKLVSAKRPGRQLRFDSTHYLHASFRNGVKTMQVKCDSVIGRRVGTDKF